MSTNPPELQWLDGDVPKALGFEDTYFSKAGGLAETRHVFLAGNRLPDRFETTTAFTIAEFGFGTGLNFLTAIAAWRTLENPPELTFVSFELFPMTPDQLAKALSAFPELGDLANELIDYWQPCAGWSQFRVAGANLVLGVGDARELIKDLKPETQAADTTSIVIPLVDAWFLDGFSPARNPELWDADLLRSAADLTAPEGTLATYTAAGWVRRNLQAAGFLIEKTNGFAGKREMVIGRKA
ncbi:tRNA (5-methylaminomethyl-2-thiouridine)(34)-methyltransferase MnmD [uncultured Roseibium sp.]|uniref:tRNA (5-methylaminomethyl-2-thiouridine)(34)-methyltransferase MnmD n=1 Tax=uncultured Roseibium sp. TaxID=1936171 RepID=UPI00260F7836|nr:tRNA (5-methylaminomethyl-2-thiouridine)(34)-methyltransferase MnmD [uncultured Roseibium sp.]